MIIAEFFRNANEKLLGFEITGHAGDAEFGEDIACASVSSATMLTVNTMTDVFKVNAKVSVLENDILLKVIEDDKNGSGEKVLLGFLTHLYLMSEEFPGKVMVKVTEK